MDYVQLIKKKQELKNIINESSNDDTYYEGLKKGVSESFKFFNCSMSFYKKYKNDVKLLMKEQNKLWLEWIKYYNKQENINKLNYLDIYNKWLFNDIFSNIQNKDDNNLLEIF